MGRVHLHLVKEKWNTYRSSAAAHGAPDVRAVSPADQRPCRRNFDDDCGDTHDVRLFSVWCPKVVALIGALPTTLRDRSIEIRMRRRTPDERITPLRCGRIFDAHADMRRQAARWTADHKAQIEVTDPALPAGLGDRAADCWRPLVAIADQLGGSWPISPVRTPWPLSGAGDGDPADYRVGSCATSPS